MILTPITGLFGLFSLKTYDFDSYYWSFWFVFSKDLWFWFLLLVFFGLFSLKTYDFDSYYWCFWFISLKTYDFDSYYWSFWFVFSTYDFDSYYWSFWFVFSKDLDYGHYIPPYSERSCENQPTEIRPHIPHCLN